jgi:hypothetical protein
MVVKKLKNSSLDPFVKIRKQKIIIVLLTTLPLRTMKWIIVACTLTLYVTIACGCKNKNVERIPPAAGIVVAQDSVLVDSLNESYFSVKVSTTEKSDSGEYHIETAWGYNIAESTIRMPKGLESATPAIRPDTANAYMMGFHVKDDTAFHDYYSITADNGTIRMKYIKTYYFQ